jgi:C4-dicarboxylate transporter DctQ subunit
VKILRSLDSFLLKLEEFILSWAIILVSFMVIGNVVSRALFNYSWVFHKEVAQYAVVIATFMGIGYAARKGRHISMSAVFDLSNEKIKKALAIIFSVGTAIVLFVLTYYAFIYLKDVQESGRVTSALQIPVYILMVFVPIGLFLGGVQFLRNAWINIKEKGIYLGTEQKDYS